MTTTGAVTPMMLLAGPLVAQAASALDEYIQYPETKLPPTDRPFKYWTEGQKKDVRDARLKLNDEIKLFQPLQAAFKSEGPVLAAGLGDPTRRGGADPRIGEGRREVRDRMKGRQWTATS